MTTKVFIRVYCETSYGQTVHVVGNTPALGNWMPTNENKLKWTQLNWWESASPILLPATKIEYKFVIKDQAGSLHWESGENRILENNNDRNIIEAFDRRIEFYNYPESLAVKVMSFNIRYDTPVDGKHSWEHRKDIVSEIVKGCDVFGLQEPLHHQLAYVKQRVGNEFDYVSWGRDDGQQRGEASPIFYRANLFSQEGCGVFWLSETPHVAGSRGWKAPLPRICSWVKLRSKTKNAPPFFVFNTHLDYESSEARKQGLHLILSKMRAIASGLPCILTGDFNSTPNEGLIAEVTNQSCAAKWGLSLVNAGANSNQATFVGFNNIYVKILNYAYSMLIDYILVSKGITVQDYKVLENGEPDRPASDHCPIVANIVIEKKSPI